MPIVTQKYIERYIATNSSDRIARFVGRALVVVFQNQTEAERQVNITNVDNGVGFTGADAHSGSITAKYFLKHGTLMDWQVERWIKRNKKGVMRIAKYWRQLDAAAEAKRSGKPSKRDPAPLTRACEGAEHEAQEAQTEWDARLAEKAAFAEQERRQEALAFLRERF